MGLALETCAAAAGLVFGLVATGLMTVYRNPRTGRPVSRAASGYAAVWIVVVAARSAFSYGSEHWFRSPLDTWALDHHITSDAITNSLIVMALVMVMTRTVAMAACASAVPHRAAARVASVVVPIANFGNSRALAVRLEGNRLVRVGTVSNGSTGNSAIERSMIVNGNLWTFSGNGICISSQTNLTRLAWIPYK